MPKFEKTSCSNCGREFGPGDHGFSHCDQHEKADDLISRSELLDHFRKERDAYRERFFVQDPDTGFYECRDHVKEACLDEMEERIKFIELFPPVEPVARLTNNNQVGCINLIETIDPNKTIDIGTMLYVAT